MGQHFLPRSIPNCSGYRGLGLSVARETAQLSQCAQAKSSGMLNWRTTNSPKCSHIHTNGPHSKFKSSRVQMTEFGKKSVACLATLYLLQQLTDLLMQSWKIQGWCFEIWAGGLTSWSSWGIGTWWSAKSLPTQTTLSFSLQRYPLPASVSQRLCAGLFFLLPPVGLQVLAHK